MSIESRPRVLLVVRGIVLNEGKILLVKRSKNDRRAAGQWELPGGKMDVGSEVNLSMEREVLEETGLTVRFSGPEMFVSSSMLNSGKYEGLAYITLVGFVKLVDGKVELSEEHDEFIWIDPNEALKMNLCDISREALVYFLRGSTNKFIK